MFFFKVKIISPNTIFTTFHVHCTYIKLFHKMSSGVGALQVEGPIVQKGSIALEVTMATKQPTSQHHHTEQFSGILTTTHTYLFRSGRSGSKNQQISQVVNRNDRQRSAKQSRAEILYSITCKPLQTQWPSRKSPPAWGSTADILVLSQG